MHEHHRVYTDNNTNKNVKICKKTRQVNITGKSSASQVARHHNTTAAAHYHALPRPLRGINQENSTMGQFRCAFTNLRKLQTGKGWTDGRTDGCVDR